MSGRRAPLSKRSNPDQAEIYRSALYEGIPDFLISSVNHYLGRVVGSDDQLRRIERQLEFKLPFDHYSDNRAVILEMATTDPSGALDIIDDCLGATRDENGLHIDAASELNAALYEGGSIYGVVVDEPADGRPASLKLERRVDEATAAAAEMAMKHETAGHHLKVAWGELYGRSPDPSKAYDRSIKAVEAAVRPVVSPNDDTATLGTMIGQIRSQPEQFTSVLSGTCDSSNAERNDVSAVKVTQLMSQLLLRSQHDRHGNHDPEKPTDVSGDEAAAALHLAVVLVQWFSTGVVAKA